MDAIKITFLLGTLDVGGTERQFIEIARRLNRQRFEFKVLSFLSHGKLRTEIEALHIPLTSLGFSGISGKFHLGSYVQLYRLFRDMVRYFRVEKPHIVQSYLFWTNVYGSIAAKIAGVPVIITGRRATMEEKYKKFPGQFLQNLSNFCATAIIANSKTAKQECLQRDKYVTDENIYIIYNGLDFNRYGHRKTNSVMKSQEFQIPRDTLIVGIISNLHPRKRHIDFLKAAALVLQQHAHTVFLVIGRDEGMKLPLKTLTRELGIQDAVIFTGERDDIVELLSIIDVQVASSVIEGLSNAILEGMAAAKPIVATDVGGHAELVVHEQTGLLVPPENPKRLAEAILRLLYDGTLREQFGRAGQLRVKTLFQVDRMMQQTETLYQHLVSK